MKNNRKVIFLFLGAFLLRIILIISTKAHPDLLNHIDWGERLLSLGPKKFYENIFWSVSWPNQPYTTMYLFLFIKILKDLIFGFFTFLNNAIPLFPSKLMFILELNLHSWLLRLPSALSDLGIAILIYKVLQKFKSKYSLAASTLFLFNPVVHYNSSVWGQTDSIINFLALTGIYLLYTRRYFFGIFLFFFSFTFKLSLIIYLPLVLILLFHYRNDWKKFIFPSIFTIASIIILAIPFSIFNNPIRWLVYMYTNRILPRQGNMLNGNAFNFWLVLFGLDLSKSDTANLFFLPFVAWGRILFIIVNLPIWLRLLRCLNPKNLLLSLFLTSFSAFLFFTNMHERYLYPIFPILTALVYLYPKKFSIQTYYSLALIHLVNLYNLWDYPSIPLLPNILSFSSYLLPRVLSLVLIVYFFRFLLEYLRSEQK